MTFEVVESPVESVEITEENGLTIIIKYKDDDAAEKVKAIDYVVEYTDNGVKEYIITKTGMLRCSLHPSIEEDGSESFYITVLGRDSNKLDNFDWLNATLAANEVAYSSLIYATGSEELLKRSSKGIIVRMRVKTSHKWLHCQHTFAKCSQKKRLILLSRP